MIQEVKDKFQEYDDIFLQENFVIWHSSMGNGAFDDLHL